MSQKTFTLINNQKGAADADGDDDSTVKVEVETKADGDDGSTTDGDDGSTTDGDDGSTTDGDDGSTTDGDDGSTAEDNEYTTDDEEEGNEVYLQKLKREATYDYLTEMHHNCSHINYEEMLLLAQITRDADNQIIDPNHKMLPFLNKYEKARILGIRIKQLNNGCKSTIPINSLDTRAIAYEEYRQKKIPFVIRRPLPHGKSEYWHFGDLEQIH